MFQNEAVLSKSVMLAVKQKKTKKLSQTLSKHRLLLQQMRDDCDAVLMSSATEFSRDSSNKLSNLFNEFLEAAKEESPLRRAPLQQPESEAQSPKREGDEISSTGGILRHDRLEEFLKDKEISVLFGGQGYDNLAEMRTFVNEGCSVSQFLLEYLKIISATLCAEVDIANIISENSIDDHRFDLNWKYEFGLNVEKWVHESRNEILDLPDWYIYSAPVSYPLTLITQFMRYIQFLLEHGMSHEDFVGRIKAGTGHSQGIICASLLSISKTTQDLMHNFLKFLRLSVYQGLRCHSSLYGFAVDGNESKLDYRSNFIVSNIHPVMSPMLSIKGLSKQKIEEYIAEMGVDEAQLTVGLVNGKDLCVVSGVPETVLILHDRIKSNEDARRVNIFFLKVGGAFHSPINESIVTDLCNDANRIGLGDLQGSDFMFKVVGTEHGKDLRKHRSTDSMRRIIELQAVGSLDYPLSVSELVDGTSAQTCIVDFGPGDGTAKLCRNSLVNMMKGKFIVLSTAGKMRSGTLSDKSLVGVETL